jgi:predicted protein tyrosine phosphatase
VIVVCPLSHADRLVGRHRASHAVSLLSPDTAHPSFGTLGADCHLRLTFHDIVGPIEGFRPPQREHAEALVAFLKSWEQRAPLLIHCWAGISRSTAAAYTALCLARPDLDEEALARRLRAASPSATPNRLLVSYADEILGRHGRMVAAIEGIGRGVEAFEGEPFVLEL